MNYINALCCCNDESVLTQSLVQSVIEQHSLLNGEANETTNNTGSTTTATPRAKTNTTTATANTYTKKQEQEEEEEKTNNTTSKIKNANKSSEQFNIVLEFLTGNQLVTVAVKTETDLDNKEVRASLHDKHQISKEFPVFKPSFAINSKDKNKNEEEKCKSVFDEQLIRPHEFIQNDKLVNNLEEPVATGEIIGNYRYYHYRSDDGDTGWGCAYRSLQSIVNWFSMNSRPDMQWVKNNIEKYKKYCSVCNAHT